MTRLKLQTLSLVLLATLGGCATTPGASGVVVGGFAGQAPPLTGGRAGQAIIQAMGGGLVGGTIGEGLSQAEKTRALEAEYRALEYSPVGQPVAWGSKASGRYGEVVAAQPYRVGSQDCRQYTHSVHLTVEPRVARGTACRNSDGTWTPLT
ncbi:MAG: hypothetical protein Q8Q62_11315 [Mesorhizobium sp.]|nr:hypothetical protein [Mesorhizobium sp.]